MLRINQATWWFLALAALLALSACGADDGAASDDDQDNHEATDDDTLDDDVADNDVDDDADDDLADDDTTVLHIELLAGGSPGYLGHSIGVAPDGTVVVAASKGRELTIYRADGAGGFVSEATSVFVRNPQLAIGRQGALHVCYLTPENDALGYATNASGAWQSQVVDPAPYLGESCALALDEDGGVHLAYYNNGPKNIIYATNISGAWRKEIADPAGNLYMGLSIAVGPDKNVLLTYYHTLRQTLTLAEKSNGAWSYQTVSTLDYWLLTQSTMALDENGLVHLAYFFYRENDQRWALYYTNGLAKDWEPEEVDGWDDPSRDYEPRFARLRIDAAGRPHLAYEQPVNQEIRQAIKTGGHWQTEPAAAWGRMADVSASFALDEQGGAHLSTFQIDVSPAFRYSTDAAGNWSTAGIDQAAFVGVDSEIAVDAAGQVHILSIDRSAQRLQYRRGQAGDWTVQTVDTGLGFSHPLSLLLDENGRAYVSYVRGHGAGDWQLVVATNAGGDWDTLLAVPTMSNYCGGGALAFGPDGRLQLAYCEDELQLATETATGWENESIRVYPYPMRVSLAVDANGSPHLAYLTFGAYLPNPFEPEFFDLLYYLTKAGNGWSRKLLGMMNFDDGLITHRALSFDPAGQARLVYANRNDLVVAWQSDDEWQTSRLLVQEGEYLLDPSAAFAADGSVHAVCSTDYLGDLWYVTDQSGELRQTLIDRQGLVGEQPSIALDQQGLVHVSYYGERALWYARFPQGFDGPTAD